MATSRKTAGRRTCH